MNKYGKLWIHPGHFAHREKCGPLTPFERKLKAFICSDFSELLDIDPWMRTARLTAKGRRIILPILRRTLEMDQPPVDMQDWAAIYPQMFEWASRYFHQWRPEGRYGARRRQRAATSVGNPDGNPPRWSNARPA